MYCFCFFWSILSHMLTNCPSRLSQFTYKQFYIHLSAAKFSSKKKKTEKKDEAAKFSKYGKNNRATTTNTTKSPKNLFTLQNRSTKKSELFMCKIEFNFFFVDSKRDFEVWVWKRETNFVVCFEVLIATTITPISIAWCSSFVCVWITSSSYIGIHDT